MAILYVDDAGSNTSPFDTWAKAADGSNAGGLKAALADAACVAGSTVYIGHNSITTYTAAVTYTNLGIVKRHQMDLEGAIVYYQKAIDLWENNHSAKSNLNVLLGGEPLKQNIIQKLFPPKKESN